MTRQRGGRIGTLLTGTIDFGGSDPVIYAFPDADPPALTKVEVGDQATFVIEQRNAVGRRDITSVAGSHSEPVSVDLGNGFIEVGDDQGSGAFGDLGGAWISSQVDGTLDWNSPDAVSWYSFQPSDE